MPKYFASGIKQVVPNLPEGLTHRDISAISNDIEKYERKRNCELVQISTDDPYSTVFIFRALGGDKNGSK